MTFTLYRVERWHTGEISYSCHKPINGDGYTVLKAEAQLPDGFSVKMSRGETMELFTEDGSRCEIFPNGKDHGPYIVCGQSMMEVVTGEYQVV